MTASKALESATSLAQYCLERYEVRLTEDQLCRLIIACYTFRPVDVDVWLKVSLMQLKCFPCGCILPPPIRLFVLLHIDVPLRGISPIVHALQEYEDRFRRVIGLFSDRHRAGRPAWGGDDVYDHGTHHTRGVENEN